MNRIAIITCALCFLLSGISHSQKECDYEDQSFEIMTQAIYDILLERRNDYDSIHLMLDGSIFIVVIDENSTMIEWLSSDYNYDIEYQRKSRMKSISTGCINAKFKYNVFGNLKTMRFNYPMDKILFEGTIIKLAFIYKKGVLVNLLEDGNWGSSIDYSVVYFE